MNFPLIISKVYPSAGSGLLRGYQITMVYPDHRDTYAVVAESFTKAHQQVAACQRERIINELRVMAA